MSYIILIVIVLVVMLSLISLFDEIRVRVRTVKHRAGETEKQKRIDQAFHLNGHLHKMDPGAFQKWVMDIYQEMGYRVKALADSGDQDLLLEKDGATTLVGARNYQWPIGREVLEVLHHQKKRMGLNHLIVISTSGFSVNAREWATETSGIELMGEEYLFHLSEQAALLPKDELLAAKTVAS
jgi:HJR/Mrr/RecB family endonuclease